MAPLFLVAIPLYIPLVAFLVYGYQKYSLVIVATFLVPVVALQRVAQMYQEQREATQGMTEAYERLEQANISFAAALVATLDARISTRPVTRPPWRSTPETLRNAWDSQMRSRGGSILLDSRT